MAAEAGPPAPASPPESQDIQVDAPLLRAPAALRNAAVLSRLQPSIVHLPSHCRLSQAVALLSKDGNAAELGPGVDGTALAEVHQEGESYWEAVAAVCAAFHLQPATGAVVRSGSLQEVGVPVQAGPVVLVPVHDPRCMVVPAGMMAVIVSECTCSTAHGAQHATTVHLGCTLRCEPHVPRESIGLVTVSDLSLSDQNGTLLTPTPQEAPEDPAAIGTTMTCTCPVEPSALELRASVQITLVEPWHVTLSLAAGQTRHIPAAGWDLVVQLVDENHQGMNNNTGPLLEFDYPRLAVLGSPEIGISRTGVQLQFRGRGSMSSMNGQSDMLLLQGIDAQPYTVTLSAHTPIAPAHTHPLRCIIPILSSSATPPLRPEIAQFVPTMLSWPAGRRTLAEAIALVGRAGSPVLLELGADESQPRDQPAFHGTFWEALATVCATYHLAPRLPDTLPPAISGEDNGGPGLSLSSGPVSVGASVAGNGGSACGPLLVQDGDASMTRTHGLGGGGNALDAHLLLRLEPHIDPDSIANAQIRLDSFGTDDQGRAVLVSLPEEPAMGARNAFNNGWRRRRVEAMPPHLLSLTVTGLADQAHWVVITGQLHLRLHHHEHLEAVIAPGQTLTLGVDASPFTLTFVDQAHSDSSHPGPGLEVAGDLSCMAELPALVAPSGQRLSVSGMTRSNGDVAYYQFPVTEAGPHRVLIERELPAGVVTLPLHHRILVPGG